MRIPSKCPLTAEVVVSPDEFVVVAGRRFVRPYFFDFYARVKRRWEGVPLVDVYADEFKGRTREYYLQAIAAGRLTVQGFRVAPDSTVVVGQWLCHHVHRHEPPVTPAPIEVLRVTADVVVVNKPGSLPVHPCGQYRKNTVLGVLSADRPDLSPLHPVHRLDRLVSGLLILARTPGAADFFRAQIMGGRVRKEYVARVAGRFPPGWLQLEADVVFDPREGKSVVVAAAAGHPAAAAAEDGDTCGGRDRAGQAARRGARDGGGGAGATVATAAEACQAPVASAGVGETAGAEGGGRGGGGGGKSSGGVDGGAAGASGGSCGEEGGGASGDVTVGGGGGGAAAEAAMSAGGKLRAACTRFRLLETDGDTSVVRCQPLTGRTHQIRVHLQHLGFPIINDPLYGGRLVPFAFGAAAASAAAEPAGGELDPLCPSCPFLPPTQEEREQEPVWLHCWRYSGDGWSFTCPPPPWAPNAAVHVEGDDDAPDETPRLPL